jgi:1-phosphofructokinase family hexose kinase
MKSAFLVVCLNPVLQKTVVLSRLREDAVNRSSEYRWDASGKGVNVARVLSQLGERAVVLMQAGGRHRDWFLSLTSSDGLNIEWVDSGSEIRMCTTLLSRENQTTTEVVEEAEPVARETEDRIREAYQRLLPRHSSIIFSGTKARGFSDDLYPRLIAEARARGATAILDVRGSDLLLGLEARPTLANPNYEEFVATFFAPGSSNADRSASLEGAVRAKLAELSASFGTAFVVTRGPRPALVAENGNVWTQAPESLQALNTTGSGDAFTAAAASALASGASVRDAVAAGHRAGAQNARLLRPGVIANARS